MDEREDLQNIEDTIVAENIDTSLEEQIKAPSIKIEKTRFIRTFLSPTELINSSFPSTKLFIKS